VFQYLLKNETKVPLISVAPRSSFVNLCPLVDGVKYLIVGVKGIGHRRALALSIDTTVGAIVSFIPYDSVPYK
jgi:hypothetical protein